ncbi:MAG: hypothetical protein ACYTFI_15755, partial [Planctomycetota bacterium]
MKLRRAITTVLTISCMSSASDVAAELQVADLATPGDGLVSRDTTAPGMLDWLDVTQTADLSWDDLLGGEGGWLADGWRSATQAEICRLFVRYSQVGEVLTEGEECETPEQVVIPGIRYPELWETLGVTLGWYPSRVTMGLYVDDNAANPLIGAAVIGSQDVDTA